MKIKALHCCLFLALICLSGIARAATITLAPVDVGKFDMQVNHNDYSTSTYHYTSLSGLYNENNYYQHSNRGYAIYDLAGIPVDVVSASILLNLTYNPFSYYPEGAMFVHAAPSQSATTLLSLPQGEYGNDWFTLLNGPEVGQQASAGGQGVGQVS